MKMIKLSSIVAGACILFLNAQAQDASSWWIAKPMVIDGKTDEWPTQFRYYDGGTRLQYSIANDSAYIYLCLKVTDEQAQMRLFRSGLNIFIDTKGKKKESVAITYPVKLEHRPGEDDKPVEARQDDGYARRDMTNLKHRVLLSENEIIVKGFTGIPDQTLPTQNGYNITAAMQWDTLNILNIEYKIPFAAAAQHSMAAFDTVKSITLGFLIKGIEAPHPTGDGPDGDGPPPGGMGTGGGMSGGGGYNGNGGMNGGLGGGGLVGGGGMGDPPQGGMGNGAFIAMAQDQKMWAKVHLSWH